MKKQLILPERLIHQATRYLLGRASYAVGEHCDWLIRNWDDLPDSERSLVKRAVEEAFARDACKLEKSSEAEIGPLGMSIDKKDWQNVRALWQKKD